MHGASALPWHRVCLELLPAASGRAVPLDQYRDLLGLEPDHLLPRVVGGLGRINLARIGPRRLAIAGGLLFAAGYALAVVALAVKSLTLFYLGYGAVGEIGIGLG